MQCVLNETVFKTNRIFETITKVDYKYVIKSHTAASQTTISRWFKSVLYKTGIDHCFTTHSTRAAASSMAQLKGVPLQMIIRSAGGQMLELLQTSM